MVSLALSESSLLFFLKLQAKEIILRHVLSPPQRSSSTDISLNPLYNPGLLRPTKFFKFLGEGKSVSLNPGIRVFEDNDSRFVLQSEILRASGKSSFRFVGLNVAKVDFQQLKREFDINPRATKAFILDQSLIRFVYSFSADLAANLKTLAELE